MAWNSASDTSDPKSGRLQKDLLVIRQQQRLSINRSGLTRIDVIVMLGAGLLLVMLFLPSVRSAKRAARKVQCLNNMRNIGLSFHNVASSRGGKLPPLTSSLRIKNSSHEAGELRVSWAISLLPALSQSALFKKIQANAVIESGQAKIGVEKQVIAPDFACPTDPDAYQKPGRMSYVVNAGFISQHLYHGDPDREHIPGSLAWIGVPGEKDAIAVHAATGTIWHQSDRFQSSQDYVSEGDGASVTLFVTENLQAGNWYDTDTAKIGFGFPVSNTEGQVPLGAGQIFESIEKPLNTQFSGETLTTAKPLDWLINANLKAKGSLPRPSSNHSGGVNVIMCDGAGKFLNESMDPHVYLKLLTANGIVYGERDMNASSF